MPVVGLVSNPLVNLSQPRASADQGSVGAYNTTLASGVEISLAASEHAGILSYKFPEGPASVVIDVSHVLPSFRGLGLSQGYNGGGVQVFPDGHYETYGVYNNGWNEGKSINGNLPRILNRFVCANCCSSELEGLRMWPLQCCVGYYKAFFWSQRHLKHVWSHEWHIIDHGTCWRCL